MRMGVLWKNSAGRDGKVLWEYKINMVAITKPTYDF